ncbi:hypothetical protein [Patulibacter sp. SYSU D01012]|uniref:hypothetical protein n=1 Tax=Patulibacter sp. SYSU D01012 TaxID=2817381 RepID=UPI001B3004EB|nr:hypothetical protein [Patulibacter sp. SYSU D01012]
MLLWDQEPYGAIAQFAYEVIDRETNTARIIGWTASRQRHASVAACVKHGWLDDQHEVVRHETRNVYPGDRTRTVTKTYRELRLTDDGDLALNVWQHRKLHAPPAPLPTLTPADREALRVAADAARLGYALVPSYLTFGQREKARMDACRQQMRRLVRDGWARRAFVGAGQSAVVPTATGTVEVADDPDALTSRANEGQADPA